MRTQNVRRVKTAVGTLCVSLLGVVILSSAALAGPESRKLDRQIDLFERVVDDMLVESGNWLVQSRHETRGRYRSGEGARFTFDAELLHRGWGSSRRGGKWWNHFFHDDDDDGVIVIDIDDWDDMDDDEIAELRRDRKSLRKKSQERILKKEERLFKRGKAEMVDVLADFGDVLTTLPDNETIELVAYLDDSEYFYENDLRQLSMTVKMSDVRAHAEGKIDEKEFVSRIVMDES